MQKSRLATIVILIVVVVLAFALNPSPEQHRTRIRAAMSERSPLAAVLGAGVLTAFASNYHSLGVASYTRIDNRIISIGAFGIVFVVE